MVVGSKHHSSEAVSDLFTDNTVTSEVPFVYIMSFFQLGVTRYCYQGFFIPNAFAIRLLYLYISYFTTTADVILLITL